MHLSLFKASVVKGGFSADLRQSFSASLAVLKSFAAARLLHRSGLGRSSAAACHRDILCESSAEYSRLGATGRAVGKALRYALHCDTVRHFPTTALFFMFIDYRRDGGLPDMMSTTFSDFLTPLVRN